MTQKEAFKKFRDYFNLMSAETVFELLDVDVKMIDPSLHGRVNRHRIDALGQMISIGDLVAYSKIGGTCKGISKGIVLGYTEGGYRVAKISRYSNQPGVFQTFDIQTPSEGETLLIQRNMVN